MTKSEKTKELLLEELASLRQRVNLLETMENERRQVEEALKNSEKKYRSLFDAMSEGFALHEVIYNKKGEAVDYALLEINQAWEPTLGFSRKEALGKRVSELFGMARPPFLKTFAEVAASGKPATFEANLTPLKKHLRVSAFSPGKGQVATVFTDITEQMRIQRLLQENEQRYRSLFEHNPDAVYSLGLDGNLTSVNQAACKLMEYTTEELMRTSWEAILPAEDMKRSKYHVRKAFKGEPQDYEVTIISKGRQKISLSLSLMPIKIEGKVVGIYGVGKNITERKLIEEQLKDSEASFKTIFEFAPDAYFMHTLKGNFLDGNTAAERLTGYKRQELIGKSFLKLKLLPTLQIPKAAKLLAKNALAQPTGPDEFTFNRKDGSQVTLEINTYPVKIRGQTVILGIARDITERKKAEEKLRESEQRFAAFMNHLPGVAFMKDQRGHYIYINDTMKKTFTTVTKEWLGKTDDDLWPFETARTLKENDKAVMSQWKSSNIVEDIPQQDSIHHWMTVKFPVPGATKRESFLGGVSFDVTDSINMAEKLRLSEEKLRLMLESATDSIVEIDNSGTIIDANDRAAQLLGVISKSELLSKNIFHFIAKRDHEKALKNVAHARKHMTTSDVQYTFIRPDGFEFPIELGAGMMKDAAGNVRGAVVIIRDITERKRAEAERSALEQKARLASHLASVGELAAGVAHEINNPLTSVVGYAQLLSLKDLSEDIRHDVNIISEGAQRTAMIVKKLLAFAGQQKPERKYIAINEAITSTIELRAYSMDIHNIKVMTSLDPGLPRTVADGGQLQEVFLNLIMNAENMMQSAHSQGTLFIKTERAGDIIRISFKDDGPGISEDNLERIFDPFFTTREVGEGTGLGLSICYGIIDEHNGRIYAESEPGKGATFVVELPIVAEGEESVTARAITAKKSEKPGRARILIVDDDAMVCQFLTRLLADMGYETETAQNANQALEHIQSASYSLVLLDINMPGVSGIELYDNIKQIAPSLSKNTVFITGDILGVDTQNFLTRTKARFTTKPFDIEHLKKILSQTLPQDN